ncbi:MAG TPA: GIY-YIG nuclease family protein [bacterium]|nr:GIY-YIG nuclease family protein [bacterium]
MKLPHCVYVLYSLQDKRFYVGYTSNLKQRLTEHFHGSSKNTSPRRPFELIFCEYFLLKKDALKREGYFKTTAGKRALNLMLKNTLNSLYPTE